MEFLSINSLNRSSIYLFTSVKMKKQNWFKKKSITASFAIISFVFGFLFLRQGRVTGNVIASNYQSFSLLSLIGLLLVFCAIIMAVYTIKRK